LYGYIWPVDTYCNYEVTKKQIFVYILYNDTANSWQHTAPNTKLISKEWLGRGVEGAIIAENDILSRMLPVLT